MQRPAGDPSIRDLLERTTRDQLGASSPETSSWVSANAGTGKTHVLTMRVLRLLLAGTPPEKILCLTYTKAAAAEMSKRVFDRLGEWAVMTDADLEKTLHTLTGRAQQKPELHLARTLFARAIETPGGLKVQTIHAFAERLLQRFPLEAGMAPGFTILDDEETRVLKRGAIDGVLRKAAERPNSALGQAMKKVIAFAVEDNFDTLLDDALNRRDWLSAALKYKPAELEAMLRRHFGVRAGAGRDALAQEASRLISKADLSRIHAVLAIGSKSESDLAGAAARAASDNAHTALESLSGLLLTGEGTQRERIFVTKTKAAHPGLDAIITEAQPRFAALMTELKGLEIVEATLALTAIADAVMGRFTAAKARRAAYDFQDLIDKTNSLLRTDGTPTWVLFKLDNGLSHILVDESQDTAPSQWAIIEGLAREFFSGAGARDEARTIFAVGDEKQSIYSFQGAAPEMFAKMGEHFESHVKNAGQRWCRVPLNLSFRSAGPVLNAVDKVFADPARTPGLSASGEAIRHYLKRQGQAGHVEIWPLENTGDPVNADPWSPLGEEPRPSPVLRLAHRIADTIQGWLKTNELLLSENRPIRPGDILILVRKRNPFAAPMVAALKQRAIPVAGADRMRLTDQIAIQDLMALGEFLTLPEDDLSLACVLKSPMFGLDDDDLVILAAGRRRTLWKSLLDHAGANDAYRFAAETLKRWRKQADFSPPFEFFASILDKDGMRRKLLGRLGPDAADGLDEFLNLALLYDESAPPSLSGFLHAVRSAKPEVKRDMEHGRNEVRVMTVHGAKGLEAPIVFLPDTCSAAAAKRQGGGLIELSGLTPREGPAPFAWSIKGASKHPIIAAANADQRQGDQQELNRLLYVAMTRARDRLYVGGFAPARGGATGCWYDLITDALQTSDEKARAAVVRLETPQTAAHEPGSADAADDYLPLALPGWAAKSAPREPQPAVPLAPSRLAPYEYDEAGEPSPAPVPFDALAEPPAAATPAVKGDDARFLRGTLTHALLQHLPQFEKRSWKKAADAFLAARARATSKRARDSIVAETIEVLCDPAFTELFGPRSRAEIPIVASLQRPSGKGPPFKITGQIDRLAEIGRDVFIIDYKTNRIAPPNPAAVAPVYLYQLAAYRLALKEIYPDRGIRAALLWTAVPKIMEIPGEMLDSFAARLWDIDVSRLDG